VPNGHATEDVKGNTATVPPLFQKRGMAMTHSIETTPIYYSIANVSASACARKSDGKTKVLVLNYLHDTTSPEGTFLLLQLLAFLNHRNFEEENRLFWCSVT